MPDHNPLFIRTPRLLLRDFVATDVDQVQAYAGDPEVTRFTSWGPNTAELTRQFLDWTVAAARAEPRRVFSFAVLRADQSDQVIGSSGLEAADSTGRQFMFGYVLAKDQWGQGLGTEVARGLVDHGFANLGAHRLFAHVFVGNVASARLLVRIGLRLEGRHRRNVWARGEWHDTETYAILRDEWRPAR